MIRMMFRHGLRLREALDMKLEQIDIENGRIYIRRLKNGVDTFHYFHRDDLKYLRLWMQERTRILKKYAESIPLDTACLFFFSSTGKRLSSDAVQKLLKTLGQKAGFSFRVHPHMLRHSCGYALANRMMDTRNLQDYLGHRNISQTVKYTASNPARFARVWG
jgi:site-specific recombinase XerD